jgi:hypothetical protein
MAQSDDNRRVAGWTVGKFKNGAFSALLPFAAKQLFAILMSALEVRTAEFQITGSTELTNWCPGIVFKNEASPRTITLHLLPQHHLAIHGSLIVQYVLCHASRYRILEAFCHLHWYQAGSIAVLDRSELAYGHVVRLNVVQMHQLQ